jgi:hypothetical protein
MVKTGPAFVHTLTGLVTGSNYYVRVSANDLGYGKRRRDSAVSSARPLMRSGDMASPYNNLMKPLLEVSGPSHFVCILRADYAPFPVGVH